MTEKKDRPLDEWEYPHLQCPLEIEVDGPPMTLTGRDSEIFANALLNPPEPNDALRRAAARYKATKEQADD